MDGKCNSPHIGGTEKLKLERYLYEMSNLTGMSRSGGMPNWDYYVVRNFDKKMSYSTSNAVDMLDDNLDKVIKTLKKGANITIVSPELKKVGKSSYGKVKDRNGNIGYVNINSIYKPVRIKGCVIEGGPNSKEFTPDKIGLSGSKFGDVGSLVMMATYGIEKVYKKSIYADIVMYLKDIMSNVGGVSLNEAFTKHIKTFGKYEIKDGDLKILSKNFGEVIAAIYILSTNKNITSVEFPKSVKEGLYDFIGYDSRGNAYYYSVKSGKGSSTAMSNINFIINNFSENNSFFKENKGAIDVILSIINSKESNTLDVIQKFFEDILPDKVSSILKELGRIHPIQDISQSSLTEWFSNMVQNYSVEEFVDMMDGIYNNILGDQKGGPSITTKNVLIGMYNSGNSKPFQNGYLYYPMGSYIVKYLNSKYLDILNKLLNLGSFLVQVNVVMDNTGATITIEVFKNKSFRFSYNGMSNKPGNRPIGFISA